MHSRGRSRPGRASFRPGGGRAQQSSQEEDTRDRFSELNIRDQRERSERGRNGRGDGAGGRGQYERSSEFREYSDRGRGGGGGGRRSEFSDRGFSRGAGGERSGGTGSGGGGGGIVMNFRQYPETEEYQIVLKNLYHEHGEMGKKVELIANYMKIDVKPMIIYHYNMDFDFADEEERKRWNQNNDGKQKYFTRHSLQLSTTFFEKNSTIFDLIPDKCVQDPGKNYYFNREINTDNIINEFAETIEGRYKKFIGKFQLVQKLDLSQIIEFYANRTSDVPRVAISFLELLLHNASQQMYYHYRRNIYDTHNVINSQKQWIKFVQGFSSAVHLTEIGPSLNVHLKTSCMISTDAQTLLQLVTLIGCKDPKNLNPNEVDGIGKMIRGLEFYTEYRGNKFKHIIKAFSIKRPHEVTFMVKKNGDEDETPTTVHEYYSKKYGILLLDYPTVVVMTGKKESVIPLELCHMVEKQFLNNTKIDSYTQNDLLRMATHKPLVYFNHISRFSNTINRQSSNFLNYFGVDLSTKPVRFSGRVLDAPKVIGGNRNDRFARVNQSCIEWAFFSLDEKFNRVDIDGIVNDIKRQCSRVGLLLQECSAKQLAPIERYDMTTIMNNIFLNIRKKLPNVKIVFFVIPQISQLYNLIKHLGDQEYGIATQCLNIMKAKRRNAGYIENILLKVNGKLCGSNSVIDKVNLRSLSINHEKTIMIGIDVNHPNDREKVKSSIACAVGSYDHEFTLYSATVRVQKRDKEEMITVLHEMMNELMDQYERYNNYLPENFIVFRDGISEGQFQYAENEINQIRTAIRQRIKNGKMMYIVTQKGHQTRFALVKPSGSSDRPVYNVASGTVVDHTITDPNYCTFFINSHFSQLGTSRPMKYVILRNDYEKRQMNMDDIEKICFYVCHNCTRFRNGPIALPVPVRYADLCAYRTKLHLEAQHSSRNIPVENQEEYERKIIEHLNSLVNLNDILKNSLFYC